CGRVPRTGTSRGPQSLEQGDSPALSRLRNSRTCGPAAHCWRCSRVFEPTLQVGDVVRCDTYQLPAVLAGVDEHIDVVDPARHVIEVDLAIFPSHHGSAFPNRHCLAHATARRVRSEAG